MVSGLLGRSCSHAFVGLADRLRRRLPNNVCSVLRTKRLRFVPDWLRHQLRSRVPELFELFKLFNLCFLRSVQLVFDLHRRICSVVRLQFL